MYILIWSTSGNFSVSKTGIIMLNGCVRDGVLSIHDGDVEAYELVNTLSAHRIAPIPCSDGGVDPIRSEKIEG